MRDLPKLSDLTPAPNQLADQSLLTNDDMEIQRIKTSYITDMNERKRELASKIQKLDAKIIKHTTKEGMLDKIIAQTYIEMDNLQENEFTRRGQKQTVLIKQLEALSLLNDTILKYEDMVQKYHKILMDIENNKFNSYLKIMSLKKEEDKADEGLGSLMVELQEMIKGGALTDNPMMDDLRKRLEEDGY